MCYNHTLLIFQRSHICKYIFLLSTITINSTFPANEQGRDIQSITDSNGSFESLFKIGGFTCIHTLDREPTRGECNAGHPNLYVVFSKCTGDCRSNLSLISHEFQRRADKADARCLIKKKGGIRWRRRFYFDYENTNVRSGSTCA